MTTMIPTRNCGRAMVEILTDPYCLCVERVDPDCPWDDEELSRHDGFGCDAYTWSNHDPDPYDVIGSR